MNSAKISTLLLASLALVAGCSKKTAQEASGAPLLPSAKVHTSVVRSEDAPALVEVTGTVRPAQRAMIAAKVMGTIEDLPVTLGQRVQKGDLLVKISAAEISAKVMQAQSQFNMARRDLERERDLLQKNASTADMVKGLEDRFAMMQAMVREAEVMLGYTKIQAPFDGVVARKHANMGDLAAPGMPLVEIEGAGDFQVEAGIPDSLTVQIKTGTELRVEVPSTGFSFSARLIELSSAADPHARTVQAKLAVPAGTTVRSGQFVRLQVPGTLHRALLVPTAAVMPLGQMERVFVIQEGRVVLRLVKTGAIRGEGIVEILSGLSDKDRVVVNAPVGLKEGQSVEVLP